MSRTPRSLGLATRRVRQTLSFANGLRVLLDLASAGTPWARPELRFVTADGATIACPNRPGARVPVYEVFAEDTYRIADLERAVGEAPVVLDIGGQVGCFTVAYATRNPRATVHSYEASPISADWLGRNVRDNGLADRVVVHPQAVSDRTGSLQLVVNGDASVLNGLTAPGGPEVEVPCVAFRDAVAAAGGHVDLVKLDTEGAEYGIVAGSAPEDWASVRQVVLEYHDVPGHDWAELASFFAEAGLHEGRHERVSARQGTVWLSRVP